MKGDKALYVCEMTAAGAAIAAFALVYLAGLLHAGLVLTLLLAWLPAAVLAYIAARAVRCVLMALLQLEGDPGIAAAMAGVRPATVRDLPHEPYARHDRD